ncbi:LIC11755 family lipoprotein [Leptospira interrogans]|uniref:LIC11755 family lipoprotein n=1 Tax=Leptospira interrogans TaxID=173 RepID=UPI000774D746|nr:hypothetical protein [Leptospira interrogans]OQM32067.1 hypothetical protein DV38_05395 [Leptospira interrogans]
MKFKFVFVASFLLFTLDSCRGKGNSAFLFPITNVGEFKFFYEPENTFNQEIQKEILEEWKNPSVKIHTVPGIVCLFSGTVSVFGISVCFPDQNGNTELELQNILNFWSTHPNSGLEPEFLDYSLYDQASISIQLNKNLLEDINKDWFVLSGSKELDRMLKKEKFPETNWISVFSENSILRPHSTNSFMGFSVLATKGKVRILFSSRDFVSFTSSLVLEIPGNESVLTDFFSQIQKQNLNIINLCKNDLPVLSEVFGGTESFVGRFLEFSNSKKEPVCFKDLELETISGSYPIFSGTQFLIPGETILKTESGSVLPGSELSYFSWLDLKKKGNLTLKSKEILQIYKNSEKNFLEGERYYSSQNDFYSTCSDFFVSNSLKRFCMNPGFSFSNETGDLNSQGDLSFCNLDNFQIEEANLTGLFLDGKLNSKHKFIDLEYFGNNICNPNYLSLESGEKEIPIWLDTKILKPGEILTLGKRDFIKGEILLSQVDLKDFEYKNTIFLKDRISKKIKILSNGFLETPILKRTDGSVFSILFRNGIKIPHPRITSDSFLSEISDFHFMNPGKRTEISDSSWNKVAEVSEISWMGSYDGNSSISADRFIEIDSGSASSQILEIISGTKSYRFLTSLQPGKNVFSIGKLICFPNVETWIVPEFNLSNIGKIRLLSTDEKNGSDWVIWDSMGINSTSQKLRRSVIKVKTLSGKSVWKNSALSDSLERKSSCVGTEASPGYENRTFPFLYKEYSENLNSILDPWISFNFTQNQAGVIETFKYQPNFSIHLNVSKFLSLWSELYIKILENTDIRKNSMTYLIPLGGEGLIGIPGSSGILISGIYPNPSVTTNEWFSICNLGSGSVEIRSLEIRDSSSADRLVEYSFRFGNNLPVGWNDFNPSTFTWSFGDRFLNSGECGYVLSPNFKNESVPFSSVTFRKIFTIDKTNTIGNGIGKNEGLDLFQEIQGVLFHIHSYGNQLSPFPFAIDAETDDLILLKENRTGDSISDYEIKKKERL